MIWFDNELSIPKNNIRWVIRFLFTTRSQWYVTNFRNKYTSLLSYNKTIRQNNFNKYKLKELVMVFDMLLSYVVETALDTI